MLLRFCYFGISQRIDKSRRHSALPPSLAEKDKDIFLISSENNFSRATSKYEMVASGWRIVRRADPATNIPTLYEQTT